MSAIAVESRSQMRAGEEEEQPRKQYSTRRSSRNIFDEILRVGHDEDFEPHINDKFVASSAPAGSQEKIDVLAWRVEMGYPLWHDEDRVDYSGITGKIAAVVAKRDADNADNPSDRGSSESEGTSTSDRSSKDKRRYTGKVSSLKRSSLQDVVKGAEVERQAGLAKKRQRVEAEASPNFDAIAPDSKPLSAKEIVSQERAAIKKRSIKKTTFTRQAADSQKDAAPDASLTPKITELATLDSAELPELQPSIQSNQPMVVGMAALQTNSDYSSTAEIASLKAPACATDDEAMVLRVYDSLKQAVSGRGITESALKEFTNQNRRLLSVLLPGEVSA
jgi:hypothetical protein